MDVENYLDGTAEPSRREYNLLVDALNERMLDLGFSRTVVYAA
jgi:hypothetical protein